MVRTKDTAGVKVVGAKASRKAPPPAPATPASGESSASKNKYAGGNPYCPRETPDWQKPITHFFIASTSKSGEGCSGASSSSSSAEVITQPGQSCNGENSV